MKWVKHDTDANQDAKLQNVLLDYGLEGYGLYWYCIELIAGKVDKENITFELEHDARIIARNTGVSPQKVSEMMKYFVDIGLFENTSGVVTCLKLARRLDKSMTSNPEMRELIGSLKNHDPVMTESESIMQDKIRLEEIRLDKNIKDSKQKAKRFTPPAHSEAKDYFKEQGCRTPDLEAKKFIDYWDSAGWTRKSGKMKCWKASIRTWMNNNFGEVKLSDQQKSQGWS